MLTEYQPSGFEEKLVVREIAETIWRKNRFKASETQVMEAYSYVKSAAQEEAQKRDVGTAMIQDAAAYGTIPGCLAAEHLLDQRLWKLFDRLKKIQKERKELAGVQVEITQVVPEG